MIKLALIGRDIQHSKSPEIYRKLLQKDIHYDLLDYPHSDLIPSALDLFKTYQGISITSPYKKHFVDQVNLSSQAKEIGAINCIRKDSNGLSGENTDFLAIIDTLERLIFENGSLNVIVLGDGVMAKTLCCALKLKNVDFKLFSRRIDNDLNRLSLSQVFQTFSNPLQKIVINTCSREFIFNGELKKDIIFWDFNYNFLPHIQSIPQQAQLYFDGLMMLELQAIHALAFWSITHF